VLQGQFGKMALQHTVMALQHTVTHCNTLQHTATHCDTLQDERRICVEVQQQVGAGRSKEERGGEEASSRELMRRKEQLDTPEHTLQHTATHCNTLQHTATPRSALQHAAEHCNTQQHTAVHCNALQHTAAHWGCGGYAGVGMVVRKDFQRKYPVIRKITPGRAVAASCAVAVGDEVLLVDAVDCTGVLQCVAVCCSVVQCVAACCSVVQCGAVCCSRKTAHIGMLVVDWLS